MSTNVEIEAKILVTELEFNKICQFLNVNVADAIIQTNYYIDDSKGSLRSYGFSLRIRYRDKQYTLTLKSPLAEGTLEKNQTLTNKEYETFIKQGHLASGGVTDFLEMLGFDITSLMVITSLTTWRIDSAYEDRILSLDRNVYGSVTDYEIECEQSAIHLAAETLKRLCQEVGITYRPNKISKHARAIRNATS